MTMEKFLSKRDTNEMSKPDRKIGDGIRNNGECLRI